MINLSNIISYGRGTLPNLIELNTFLYLFCNHFLLFHVFKFLSCFFCYFFSFSYLICRICRQNENGRYVLQWFFGRTARKKTAGAKAPAVCNGLFLTIEMFAIFFLHFFCYPCAPKGMPVPLTCFSDLQFHATLPEYRQVLYLP